MARLLQVMLAVAVPRGIRVVGERAPGVLLLLRDLLLLSGAALLQWLLARWLPTQKVDCMASPAASFVAALLLLPPGGESRTFTGRRAAELCDRLAFLVLGVAVAVLLARLAP